MIQDLSMKPRCLPPNACASFFPCPSLPETLDRREAKGHGQESCQELLGRGARHWGVDTWPGLSWEDEGMRPQLWAVLWYWVNQGDQRTAELEQLPWRELDISVAFQHGNWGQWHSPHLAKAGPSPSQKANVICHSHLITVGACPCSLPGWC